MRTIKITSNLLFEYLYKRQIYQIAESNRIEKIDSVARIESNQNFFCPNWNALVHRPWITEDRRKWGTQLRRITDAGV